MLITNRYKRVPLDQVVVRRGERQRRVVETKDLVDSVRRHGVLNPIIVTKDLTLVAGERRLAASLELGLLDIPVRFIEDLTQREAQIIELEENLKRADLHWRDETAAIARIHALYEADDGEWTQTKTAEQIGINVGHLSEILRVARDLDNPKIALATGMKPAYNILARVDQRRMGDALSDILEAGSSMFKTAVAGVAGAVAKVTGAGDGTGPDGGADTPPPPIAPPPEPESILNVSFLDWAPAYTGQPFNFIHCDFPYGINAFAGPQSGKLSHHTYDDDSDVYWALIRCLCKNLDRVMSHSAHMVFWFSMDHYERTLDLFAELRPELSFLTQPLIWHKTDNVGILSDPKRRPRHVYETALIASREDRLIVRAVGDAYGAPTDKTHHPSTKPEPVLRQFFQMFVDEHTRLLDPTCGSGSALRAAESLGAERVLGLEIDPEHCANAKSALRTFRAMRKASK
jgi:ParB family chromosome partitioning protein